MNQEAIHFAKSLVLGAGSMLKGALASRIDYKYKAGDQRELLTDYDLKIEKYLISHLNKRYPDHRYISEEQENQPDLSGLVWLIDPIDGTTNFVCFKRDFAISLALYQDGSPLFGLVYDVMKDDLYLGITGQGAFLNERKLPRLQEVALKDCILDSSLNSVQIFYHQNQQRIFDIAQVIRGHRCLGAASLSICKIALGEIQIYLSAKLKAWDFAAAGIILSEVGGYYGSVGKSCYNMTGESMAFMACSSPELFEQVCHEYFG